MTAHPTTSPERDALIKSAKDAAKKSVPSVARVPAFETLRLQDDEFDPARGLLKFEKADIFWLVSPPVIVLLVWVGGLFVYGPINPTKIWELVGLVAALALAGWTWYQQGNKVLSAEGQGSSAGDGTLFIRAERWIFVIAALGCFAIWLFSKYWSLHHAKDSSANWWYLCYGFAVFLVTLVFATVDFTIATVARRHVRTLEASKSLAFASAPVAVCVAVVWLYLLAGTLLWAFVPSANVDIDKMHEFVGGALAFQMLVSNAVYISVTRPFFDRLLLKMSENSEVLD